MRTLWACLLVSGACGSGSQEAVPPTLYVAHEGSLAAYDLAEGAPRGQRIEGLEEPTSLQALDDGTLVVHSTATDEIVFVDPLTSVEIARLPASGAGGRRPVDGYLTPAGTGARHWVVMNDGTADPETNTMVFVDLTLDEETGRSKGTRHGEARLGTGHHQAAFAASAPRVIVTNFSDCEDVVTVFDFTDHGAPEAILTIDAEGVGFDGAERETTCDPTFEAGVAPAPHGCATSTVSGRTYCNVTGLGNVISIDAEADPPTFRVLATTGSGGGYAKARHDGAFVYTVQARPREGEGGQPCQIGQLVTIDAAEDEVVHTLPLFYEGPDCTRALAGTDEETAGPGHVEITPDDQRLFVTLYGGFMVTEARVRQEVVIDLSDPAVPIQLPSIAIGTGTGHHGEALTGDGATLYVADTIDGTVTEIDVASLAVTRTLAVEAMPRVLATYASEVGPSLQHGPTR